MSFFKKFLSTLLLSVVLFHVNPASTAPIKFKPDGVGDALIYPVFIGYFENWFAIQNNASRLWLQGHLRFRGAAWAAELLSFDVILAPGDVMWFRLADVDGDGQWEIDQSADPLNFRYTGLLSSCDNGAVSNCMEAQHALEPAPSIVSEALLTHQRNIGYIEFIGECELCGMTRTRMFTLLAGSTAGMQPNSLTTIPNGYGVISGTNCWAWSDAANGFAQDTNGPAGEYGLGEFPNVVSGTGFIRLPGRDSGLAFNAEALVNFRTAQHPHRVDSYRVVNGVDLDAADAEASQRNRSVILHDDNYLAAGGGATPFGHYLYRFETSNLDVENRLDEVLMSALTAFGPTLADGDDYDLTANAQTIDGEPRNIYGGENRLRPVDGTGVFDEWDSFHFHPGASPGSAGDGRVNSIAEVEEAIRVGGQRFSGLYIDKERNTEDTIQSRYLMLFPTKMFYGENVEALTQAMSVNDYRNSVVTSMLLNKMFVELEIWDIEGGEGNFGCDYRCFVEIPRTVLSETLSTYNVDFFKNSFLNVPRAQTGRVIIDMSPDGPQDPRYQLYEGSPVNEKYSWPGLGYTFEVESNFTNFGQWRSMQRSQLKITDWYIYYYK